MQESFQGSFGRLSRLEYEVFFGAAEVKPNGPSTASIAIGAEYMVHSNGCATASHTIIEMMKDEQRGH